MADIAAGQRTKSASVIGENLTEQEFQQIRDFLYQTIGIDLAPAKKVLVAARLAKRLRHFGLHSYGDYFALAIADSQAGERQMMLDLLTTNETYFFREPGHFDYLRDAILPERRAGQNFRVWSAASSSGEEAYSIAMLLADKLGTGIGKPSWEVFGSDVSRRVLVDARSGHYSMARTEGIPPAYLKKYCLRGTGPQAGTLLIGRELRERVSFAPVNLKQELPTIGLFDLIFLRNVLIYFDHPTKQSIVTRVLSVLKPGGYLLIGHSDTLHGVNDQVRMIKSSIYLKP